MTNHPGRQPSKPAPTVGAMLHAARLRAALTQTQAARLLGVALRTWQQWEAGDRGIPLSALELWLITCIVEGHLPGDDEAAQWVRPSILAAIA